MHKVIVLLSAMSTNMVILNFYIPTIILVIDNTFFLLISNWLALLLYSWRDNYGKFHLYLWCTETLSRFEFRKLRWKKHQFLSWQKQKLVIKYRIFWKSLKLFFYERIVSIFVSVLLIFIQFSQVFFREFEFFDFKGFWNSRDAEYFRKAIRPRTQFKRDFFSAIVNGYRSRRNNCRN